MKKLFASLLLLGMMVPFGASAQLQLKSEAPARPDNAPLPDSFFVDKILTVEIYIFFFWTEKILTVNI